MSMYPAVTHTEDSFFRTLQVGPVVPRIRISLPHGLRAHAPAWTQRPVAAQLGLRRHLSARGVRAVCAAISQLSAALHPCRGSLLALHRGDALLLDQVALHRRPLGLDR